MNWILLNCNCGVNEIPTDEIKVIFRDVFLSSYAITIYCYLVFIIIMMILIFSGNIFSNSHWIRKLYRNTFLKLKNWWILKFNLSQSYKKLENKYLIRVYEKCTSHIKYLAIVDGSDEIRLVELLVIMYHRTKVNAIYNINHNVTHRVIKNPFKYTNDTTNVRFVMVCTPLTLKDYIDYLKFDEDKKLL